MTKWETQQLGEVATLQRGFDLPSRNRRPGRFPIVSSSGLSGWHSQPKVLGPGVVTGRYGTIGGVFYTDDDFWPLNTTLWVSNFHGNDPKFVYYLLQTVDFDTHSGKSGVPGVNRNDLHVEPVLVPPSIQEQRTVASALADTDDLIASLERLIAKKRAIKQGMMQELLTGRTRLPGFSTDWEIMPLRSVLTVRHGRSQHGIEIPNGKYPILATGGVIGRTNTPLYSKPSVLIGRKGTIDRPQFQAAPFWTVDTLFYTELSNSVDPHFVFYLFLTIDWRSMNEASGVPSLNASTIEAVEVSMPSLEEQRAIATVLVDADEEIDALERRVRSTRAIKQGMMQELLTGRTRLPVGERSGL